MSGTGYPERITPYYSCYTEKPLLPPDIDVFKNGDMASIKIAVDDISII
jgi:hypothetical protein